ncbi:MAG: metalloregulator ArsR/SmtB family transcription factor [Rhizobiaceae bacterium]
MNSASSTAFKFDFDVDEIADSAREATDFLKSIAHEGRLMILCRLAEGECSVTELEELLSARQAAVSQQLARLRLEGIVDARREGKSVYYSLADNRIQTIIPVLYEMFCKTD